MRIFWRHSQATARALSRCALLAALCLALGACSIYRINVQQGNYLDEDAIAKVEPGMTRSQVRYLLGTPLIEDSFNTDRWDYLYYFRNGKTGDITTSRLIVHFDDDSVLNIERVSR